MCDLIEANHPIILGPSNSNLGRLIAIIAEAFNRGAVDEDTSPVAQRMLNLVREIQVCIIVNVCVIQILREFLAEWFSCHFQRNDEVFQACLQQLLPDQQVALSDALNSAAAASVS